MSVYYLTTATRRYHIYEADDPFCAVGGGQVLCGQRVRRYGVLQSLEPYLLESKFMCRRCKALYERRREAVLA